MISFCQEGAHVLVCVGRGAGRASLYFVHECDLEGTAQLLRDDLDKRLDDTVREMRRAEYESGWKDARLGRRKRDYFSMLISKETGA